MALDLSGPKTPPPAKKTAPKKVVNESRIEARAEGAAGLLQLLSGAAMMFGLQADGAAGIKHSPKIGLEAANVAEDNDRFAALLDKVIAIGPYAGLVTAVLPLALQVMVNHGRLPAAPFRQLGVLPPETLMMEMHAAALREQLAAERERQAFEQEIAALQREAEDLNRTQGETVDV